MILKSAQERNSVLEKRMQSLIVEANGEINILKQKNASLDKGEPRLRDACQFLPRTCLGSRLNVAPRLRAFYDRSRSREAQG